MAVLPLTPEAIFGITVRSYLRMQRISALAPSLFISGLIIFGATEACPVIVSPRPRFECSARPAGNGDWIGHMITRPSAVAPP